jgi:hypothetical protein
MDKGGLIKMVSQGVLNGKISKCNGDFDCFKKLVDHLPREFQVRGYRHFLMRTKIKR